MEAERFDVKACCGKMSIIFKTDQPLMQKHISFLVKSGYNELAHFTKAGILYVENMDLIITGPMGSDRLQVKCKNNNCQNKVDELVCLLKQI